MRACRMESTDTVSLAPELSIDRSQEPKVPDMKEKCRTLNKLIKQVWRLWFYEVVSYIWLLTPPGAI